MTKRENAMAILDRRQPEYYFDFMDAMTLVPDPALLRDAVAEDGHIHKDSWGTEFIWMPGSPGPHPVVTGDNAVIEDIERWQDFVKVPDLSQLDWTEAERMASQVDRSEMFVGSYCPGGLFERSHHLLGLQEALMDYILYPDEMAELLRVIADYKIALIKEMSKHMNPDVIFYHDDWGTKTSLFLPPDLWRRLIKPLHTEIIKTAHDCGMIFMHHADCFCEPLVTDMVEMGVDIWQGVIPQNDIVAIQRVTGGKLALIGGVDGPGIDTESTTEDEVRAEARRVVDTYCPAGRFFPGIAYGVLFQKKNHDIFIDEMKKYGRQWALDHPVPEGN